MIFELPEKIKKLRESRRYSQKEVAEILGLSTSIVSSYEKGERTPSVEVLLHIAGLYNCSVDYLLGRTPQTPFSTISTEGLTQEQINAILILIDTMRNK